MKMPSIAMFALLAGCQLPQDDGSDVADVDTDADTDADTDTDTDVDTDTDADTDTRPVVPQLAARVVATDLDNPFEMTFGPDGALWVTERTGKRVTRVGTDGTKSALLTLPEVLVTEGTQDGLLGMALSPGLLEGLGNGDLYLAYTYDADPDLAVVLRQVKIVRYTWDAVAGTLGSPVELLSHLPGSVDHNSGRLVFGPDEKLYYTIGDQGHNQFDSACLPNHAQDLPTEQEIGAADWSMYQGKVLRMDLDGSIPEDNPVIGGVRSHIWTYGHRNAQGLVFLPDGSLYLTEHGPKSDDELNLLEPAGNYGWPNVAGFQDDQAYVYANWSASTNPPCEELVFSDFVIPPSVPTTEESEWADPAFRPPAKTFYTVPDDFDFQDPACAADSLYFICWPTIAPSSLGYYGEYPDGIEGLGGSLLITSLKLGTLYQVTLDAESDPTPGDPAILYATTDRYRDTAISAAGDAIYVATDSGGLAMGADGVPTDVLDHPGTILELTVAR